MKRVICDQCKKETEPDHYGMAPSGQGWISVTLRDDLVRNPLDFCSKACAVAALSDSGTGADVVNAIAVQ